MITSVNNYQWKYKKLLKCNDTIKFKVTLLVLWQKDESYHKADYWALEDKLNTTSNCTFFDTVKYFIIALNQIKYLIWVLNQIKD